MTWDTQIINNHQTDVNGTKLAAGARTLLRGIHDVAVVVGSIGVVQLTEPGTDDFHKYVGSTWAIKVLAKNYVRYYGYEGGPTIVLTINADDTFSIPDQNNHSFTGIPIARPALAQFAGVYRTDTQWYGDFFSPLIINQDGTISLGPSGKRCRIAPQYDSAAGSVFIDWTSYKDTRFTTRFSITGSGSAISLSGGLNPRPQDGPVNFSGALANDQTEAFHEFVLTDEFPLFFDGSPRRPLSFIGPEALACSTGININTPDYFRLVPLDVQDSSKGYRLWCNGFYASSADTRWLGSRCISGTTDLTAAMVFKPTFPSSRLVKLNTLGYVSPWSRDPPLTAPLLAADRTGAAETLIVNDGSASWYTTLTLPTAATSRSISRTKTVHARWHYLLLSVDIPLHLTQGSWLQSSSGSFLTPGGDGTTLFHFAPVDANVYQKGYRLSCGGDYVAGTSLLQGRTCVKFSANVQDADVFMLRIVSDSTFVVQNTTTLRSLSLPIDQNGQVLSIVDYLLPGDRGAYGGAYQIFQLPTWSTRLLQMAYLNTTEDFCLQWPSNNKIVCATTTGTLSLATAESIIDKLAATVSVTVQVPTARHSGYLVIVGGSKYIKFAGSGMPPTLVNDPTQATPLCAIRHGGSSLSFWHCMSNHVLSSTDGNAVTFVELNDPMATEPLWTVTQALEHSHAELLRFASDDPTPTRSLNDTVYLKPIVNMLKTGQSGKRGCTWNVSFNNTLPPDWLVSTPNHPFIPYVNFEQRVLDPNATNDFKLKAQSAGDPVDPKHPAVPLNSSITAPGGSPLVLKAGHSYQIYEKIYKVITSAEKFVDFMTLLSMPTGEFLVAIRNAITFLSKKPQAQNITIRFLFGNSSAPPSSNSNSTTEVLQALVRDVTSSNMKVYVGYANGSPFGWSHTKLVAADGNMALVGGHNCWSDDYLGDNPVQDVSMLLSGLAATDAHQYADCMWDTLVKDSWTVEFPTYGFEVINYPIDVVPETRTSIVSFTMPNMVIQTAYNALPISRAFAVAVGEQKHVSGRTSGTGVPVLSVARDLRADWGTAASDQAFNVLIDSASTSIHISAQMMKNDRKQYGFDVPGPDWNDEFMNALARALVRGVSVKIFMSNASLGSGTSGKDGYQGDPPGEVVGQLQGRIIGKTPSEIGTIISSRLKVQSFPPATTWGFSPTDDGCKNHAKMMVIDSCAVSIGSQNFYPTSWARLAEYTYIFEDATRATEVIRNLFTPMENWCLSPPPPPAQQPPPTSYTVSITSLYCVHVSDDDSWNPFLSDQTNYEPEDEIYLKRDSDGKIWPDGRYQNFNTGKSVVITNVLFTVKDSKVVISVWDQDWLSPDDHLGDFEFDPTYLVAHVAQGQVYSSFIEGAMDGSGSGRYQLSYNARRA
ncbi:hypothetical protein LTS15_005693 [Exophiala xenobiotica]|nr:hypothetical protein LTS15_005693 [Exophiala xenobiotica]